jgi:uncharacterized protein YneF (UPF0154 family)
MDTTTMAILGANMLAKIIMQAMQDNSSMTEEELTALIAAQGSKIKASIDTINSEMAKAWEAK